MRRIALEIGYEGTYYVGWQRQENGLGVQQVIEDAVQKLFGESVFLMGAGRTDAGVHARGQVAAMDLQHSIPAEKLLRALNANIPEDVRIYRVWEAPADFHPRFQAIRKTYAYRFYAGSVMPPEMRRFYASVRGPLDEEAMKKGLSYLIGEHDFIAFRSSGGQNKTTVRRIERAELLPDGEGMRLEVTGNGFLYNMVRIIAGTAFAIGQGKIQPESVMRAIESGNRELLGPTAPPEGLMMMRVEYDESVYGYGADRKANGM